MSFNPTEFLTFWFTIMRPYWFGCPANIDKMVNDKWSAYLDYEFTENLDDNTQTLAQIILYDQISRHVFRFREQMERISIYDKNALELFEKFYLTGKLTELNPEQRCFALMPWRHSKNEMAIWKCLNLVNEWLAEEVTPMYTRFYQATVKSLANINKNKYLGYSQYNHDFSLYRPVLDPASPNADNTCILSINSNHKLVKEFKKWCKPKSEIVVSVSGGVDSMVCLALAKACYPDCKIKAISINYCNREEQSLEIDMVNYFCKMLNIDHYVRVINEIKRVRDSHRQFYESITREIRFDAYKNVISNDDIPVILGHNQDDTLENVFSNIKKRINYDNLFGMEHESIEKDVNILRPLLEVPKAEIIAFAKMHKIPYTYDSTPSWSERGRLRDILMPSLKSFDRDIIPGIIEMANNYKQIYSVYKKSIPKVKGIGLQIQYVNCDFNIDILDYWKQIFTNAAIQVGVSFVSNKSIQHFISQIKINDDKNIRKIILSKDLYAIVNKSTNIILIYLTN